MGPPTLRAHLLHMRICREIGRLHRSAAQVERLLKRPDLTPETRARLERLLARLSRVPPPPEI